MERVGFIGLGLMGQAMARNLQRANFPLTVFARNMARARELVDAGASLAMSAKGVAEASEIVFINVSDDAAVENVLFDKNGVAAGARRGSIVVDMGTTSPTASRAFAARLHDQGVTLLDAPVSGGEIGAIDASLSIMVGGFAYSRILEVHGRRMLERNFTPGFRARLHQKDMGIVLDEAQRLAMALPASAQAAQLLNSLVGQGYGEAESSALIRVIEALAGIEPPTAG